jgi:hypothetical protein
MDEYVVELFRFLEQYEPMRFSRASGRGERLGIKPIFCFFRNLRGALRTTKKTENRFNAQA